MTRARGGDGQAEYARVGRAACTCADRVACARAGRAARARTRDSPAIVDGDCLRPALGAGVLKLRGAGAGGAAFDDDDGFSPGGGLRSVLAIMSGRAI